MPLPQPVSRKHLHSRQVLCEGFERDDGLWDIEARLKDSKTYGFDNRYRGRIEAGELVHGMVIRVTLDLNFVIHDVVASSEDTPFLICKRTEEVMRNIIGLRIGPGWMRQVKERIETHQSCTHLIELLAPVATTAYQTMHGALEARAEKQPSRSRPRIIDSCLALASDGEAVKIRWPQFYTGNDSI